MRQGLAIAFSYFFITQICKKEKPNLYKIFCISVMPLLHFVSIIPSLIGFLFEKYIYKRINNKFLTYLYISFITIFIIRLVLASSVLSNFSRLEFYMNSEEYGAQLSYFNLGLIKSIGVYLIIIVLAKNNLYKNKAYCCLLFLYSVGIGARIGFIDIAIFSGRIGSALTYSEIFLLPLTLRYYLNNSLKYIMTSLIYFLINIFVMLYIQYPDFIEVYFDRDKIEAIQY
jgi:hypothetical protein